MIFEASISLIFIILKLESPARAIVYYHSIPKMKNSPISRLDFPAFSRPLDNIIVDFEFTHYVSTVTIEIENKRLNPEIRIFSKYDGWIPCAKPEASATTGYTCNKVGRIVHIEIKEEPGDINSLNFVTTDLKLDNYIGCFDAETATSHSKDKVNSSVCDVECGTVFFGVLDKERKCICVRNLSDLVTVDPVNCNRTCESNYEPCGGIKHFSVYSRERTQKNMVNRIPRDEDWRCIIERKDGCFKSENGRRGLNGEYIDCTDMNGNCGDMRCDMVRTISFGVSVCRCEDGFYSDNTFNCHDVDECKASSKCNLTSSECRNSPGSYHCDCNDGYEKKDDFVCLDINECDDMNICDRSSSECKNIDGGYNCACKSGFEKVSDLICKDIDECQDPDKCPGGDGNVCRNRIGSYNCECSPGYRITRYPEFCRDINECLETNSCDESTTSCQNFGGGYSCDCLNGYKRKHISACEDRDECQEAKCDTMSTLCSNNIGSYECLCLGGFVASPLTTNSCDDIDECDDSRCDASSATCKNTPGTYTCKCLVGFKYLSRLRCEDIDECSTLLHHCGKMSTCSNTIGSFDCSCPKGTRKLSFQHAVECQDIDECSDKNKCIEEVSFCVNMPFGYVCQCFRGYVNIDNFTCKLGAPTVLVNTTFSDDLTTTEDTFSLTDFYEANFQEIVIAGSFILVIILAVVCRCFTICMKRPSAGSSSASDRSRASASRPSFDGRNR